MEKVGPADMVAVVLTCGVGSILRARSLDVCCSFSCLLRWSWSIWKVEGPLLCSQNCSGAAFIDRGLGLETKDDAADGACVTPVSRQE